MTLSLRIRYSMRFAIELIPHGKFQRQSVTDTTPAMLSVGAVARLKRRERNFRVAAVGRLDVDLSRAEWCW
jgi:hypothetical protein